jgi:hypothetical protein
MSEVISFRLNPDNPREAKALEILRGKQSEGFSSRQVLTDALNCMIIETGQAPSFPVDEFIEALKQVSELLKQIKSDNHTQNQPIHFQAATLNENFLRSVKVAARPGMNFYRK